jgi:hypothetical protein
VPQKKVSKYEEVFGKLAVCSAQVVEPTLIATVFGGLGIWKIRGACAVSEIAMIAPKGADDLLTVWRIHRTLQRNGFAYLTNL